MKVIKRNIKFFFLLSEASGTLAASIYGVILSFVIQSFVKSQFVNSLSGNLTIAASVIVSFFAGYIVDKKSPWKIILLSDVILIPLLIGLILSFNLPNSIKLITIIFIDIVATILGEFDSISRPKYLRLVFSKHDLDLTLQSMNIIQTIFSILGYLLVFLSVAFFSFDFYFKIILVLYLVSAISIFLIPREKSIYNSIHDESSFKEGFSTVFKFFNSDKEVVLLHSAYVIYMLRNQLVMSLLVFRIGKLNPTFDKLHIIGTGIVCGVGIGLIFNLISRKMSNSKRKLLSNLLFFA